VNKRLGCWLFILCLVVMLYSSSILAAPHQHGKAFMNLVLERNELIVELQVTAYDVVGFEKMPVTESDVSAVEKVIELLNKTKEWLNPVGGLCVQKSSVINNPFEISEDSQKNEQLNHADFKVRVSYTCSDSEKLIGFNLRVQEYFRAINEIELQWIIHDAQGLTIIDRNNHEIRFNYE